MADLIEKLRKRRSYPVTIGDETIHVRALLDSEHRTLLTFQDEPASFGYAIGCSLLNEDGSQGIVADPDETPQAYGARVLELLNLPTDTRREICEAILKLTTSGKPETLEKN